MFLFSCLAASTATAPPPMSERSGVAPKAAMLPIGNTNDKVVSDFVTQYLSTCLQDRNVFDFVPQEQVVKAVTDGNYDMTKVFGLKDAEHKALADELGVNYTIHGVVTIKKTLQFTGWRKDADLYIYVNDGRTGKKVDSWRSTTEFAFGDSDTVMDAEKMAESAANHICTKILGRSF